MAVKATMRAYEFGARHCEALCKMLGLNLNRFPWDTTFRRVLQKLDFGLLAQQFEQWAKEHLELEPGEGIAIDGKSIKSTVEKEQSSYQNFVSMVSVYSQRQVIVLTTQAIDHKSSSELKVVQRLLEVLALQDVVVTPDALHIDSDGLLAAYRYKLASRCSGDTRCLTLPRHVCGGILPRKAG